MSCFFNQRLRRTLWLTGSLSLWLLSTANLAQSQITPDRSLPNNTAVILKGNTSLIQGGTRSGSTLFHSFQEFSIPTGQEAYFNNALDIQNILSRVTGGNISNIDGTLRANGTANLFLINPNGIIFGPNAQLNIGGSFIGSTATSIKLSDGMEFSATNLQAPPLLTINVPVGLQFGSNPGKIVNQSQSENHSGLQVLPGQTLALVGGDVILDGGNLMASQGRIELGSVASVGFVSLTPLKVGEAMGGFALGYEGIENFGNIELSGAAVVNASGLGGGTIQVRGGQVALIQGSRLVAETFGNLNGGGIDIQATQFGLQDGAFVSTSTFGSGAGGSLSISANTVELTGTTPLETARQLLTSTFNPFNLRDGLFSLSVGSGKAGDLTIDAGQLIMQNGANVLTTAIADGAGGNLTVRVSELAELSNGSLLFTGTAGTGNAGNFTITAKQLQVLDGTALSTTPGDTSTGRGGDLSVTAESVELRGTPAGAAVPGGLFTTTLGAGDAGDLTVATGQLLVDDGAQISASSAGRGRGGNLSVTADSVELSGKSADGRFLGGVFTSSSLLTVLGQQGSAPAGNLTITTRQLSVRDGAQISAATGSAGSAGNLNIKASESVEVSGFATSVAPSVESVAFGVIGDGIVSSAIEANTSGAGGAGDLKIATEQLIVRDGAEIGVRATGSGAAGNLDVKASSILLDNQGAISGATVAGTGGNIHLQASDLRLQGNSRITTNTGNSDGGNITIDADTLVAMENSDITANAQKGRGGRVSINAQGIFGTEFGDKLTPESDITATSDLGPEFNGIVKINVQGIDPNRGLVQLPANVTEPSEQIATGCAADRGNRFVVTGRGGLPEDPTQMLRGQSVWQDLRLLEGSGGQRRRGSREELSVANPQSPIMEATGWIINAKGQVELVAHSPQVTPKTPWYTPADCHTLSSQKTVGSPLPSRDGRYSRSPFGS